MMKTSRLSWLDIMKGIGIILVVVGHISSNKIIFNWLYSFHMPLFFFAAGWVYKKKQFLIDIKRRIQTIVIPYFSFGLVVLIYWQLIERKFRYSNMSFTKALLGLLSGEYNYLDFNVHLWFLPCFFLTVILFNVIVNITNKKIAYIISAVMSLIFIAVPLPEMLWGLDRVFMYIAFYAIGDYISDDMIYIYNFNKSIQIFIAFFMMVVNFILSYFSLTTGIMWFVAGSIGVGGAMIVYNLINKNKFLEYLGQISLLILCIHGPIYRVVVKIMSILINVNTDIIRQNFLMTIIVVIITLSICSIAYKIIIYIAPWMLGKRKNSL